MGIITINAYITDNAFHVNPISIQLNCDRGKYQVRGFGYFAISSGIIRKPSGGFFKAGDQIPVGSLRGQEGNYKKLLNVLYLKKSYWFDTTEQQIIDACRQQGSAGFTKIIEDPKKTFTADMPDGTKTVWHETSGKGFDGFVETYGQLPAANQHKDEIWYVVTTTIPSAMGNIWKSDGTDWISSLTLLKAKGELFTFSTEQDILSPGTDGDFLMADSSSPTGLSYQTIISGVSSVTGTPNRITVSPTVGNVVVDIASNYVGQTSITTLGVITTGTWNATVVGTIYGGTGLISYTIGDTIYASASNVLSKLGIGSSGQVLMVSAGLPSWQTIVSGVSSVSGTVNRITVSPTTGAVVVDIASTYVGQTSIVTLGTVITGVWNATIIGTIYGGTGLSSYTTGDIIYASASNVLSKLGVGSNGQVLTLAAGIPSWATPTTGTVSTVSVVTANGLAGTVATATTTPAITLTTTITGLLTGNGTAIAAATTTTGLTISGATQTVTVNLSTGISGGQSVIGGTGAAQNLTASTTTNASKGKFIIGTSAYDESTNRWGIGMSSPAASIDITGATYTGGTYAPIINAIQTLSGASPTGTVFKVSLIWPTALSSNVATKSFEILGGNAGTTTQVAFYPKYQSSGQMLFNMPDTNTLFVVGTAGIDINTRFSIESNSNSYTQFISYQIGNVSVPNYYVARKTRSATNGQTHTIVQNNDQILAIYGQGSTGSAYAAVAGIEMQVEGAPSASSMSGRMIFYTTVSGALVATEVMRMDSLQNVGIGTLAAPSARLHLISTTEQFRAGYSSSVYVNLTVSSGGVGAFSGSSGSTFDLQKTTKVFGTATNDSAASGYMGEYSESTITSGSAVGLVTATATNITSISLTAGDWDIEGIINFVTAAASASDFKAGSNSTSATFGADNTWANIPYIVTGLTDVLSVVIPTRRFSLSATTTVYLIALGAFTLGTISAYGLIRARRVR